VRFVNFLLSSALKVSIRLLQCLLDVSPDDLGNTCC
jgi:hypothetical protein